MTKKFIEFNKNVNKKKQKTFSNTLSQMATLTTSLKVKNICKFIIENICGAKKKRGRGRNAPRFQCTTANGTDKLVLTDLKALVQKGFEEGHSNDIFSDIHEDVLNKLEQKFAKENPSKLVKIISTDNNITATTSITIKQRLHKQFEGKLNFELIDSCILDIKQKVKQLFLENADRKNLLIISIIPINSHEIWMDQLENAKGFHQYHTEDMVLMWTNPDIAICKYFDPNGQFRLYNESNNEQCYVLYIYIYLYIFIYTYRYRYITYKLYTIYSHAIA